MNVEVLLVSTDPPAASKRWLERAGVPFRALADEDHRVADRFAVPISRYHPKAWTYEDGFTQPAVFAYRGEEPLYVFVAAPRLTNLFGAAGRPAAEEVLEAIRPRLASDA
ncbi:MAG: peroxiredoxin family protein [Planctomycetes bacterium]|nr:peroxiredoxin family protein [Planctomycetota bacterium]